ncbi:MAG: STAS domain-containing protein [Desulfuromonadaceae bacterium]|nr:STAS domain-containing protein [Desulfuromonadaceae bacterium]
MTVTKSSATSYLNGNWTIAGIVQQVPRLPELKLNDNRTDSTIAIDCSGIEEIDMNGFELLHVWLNCIKLRGLRAELVNMSDSMRDAQKRMGIKQPFEGATR